MAVVGSRSYPLGKALHSERKREHNGKKKKLTDNKKEILQGSDRDDLPLPAYWMRRLPSNAPPGPESALPNPGPAGAPAAALPPAPLEKVELPPWQALIPGISSL